jgi:hypothetical protein
MKSSDSRRRNHLTVGAAAMTALVIVAVARPPSAAAQQCAGDCDGNGSVTINELILGVSIALGNQPISACRAFDCQHTGMVPINCLIQGVNEALNGCSSPMPTRTATALPNVTPTPTTPTGTESVCGGPVRSVPELCDLSVDPNPVAVGGSLSITFKGSDLEGDDNALCTSVKPKGAPPNLQCQPIQPTNAEVNQSFTIGPLPIPNGTPPGVYTLVLEVHDKAGHRSNSVAVDFTVAG